MNGYSSTYSHRNFLNDDEKKSRKALFICAQQNLLLPMKMRWNCKMLQ